MDIIISAFSGIVILFLILGIIYSLNRNKIIIMERLNNYTREPDNILLHPELAEPFKQRVGKIISHFFNLISNKIVPKNKKETYQKRLQAAGTPWGLTADSFIVIKYLIIFLCILFGIILHNIFCLAILLIAGLIIPDLFLRANENRRKNLIIKSLPDILDLLSVSVEAGLSFDSALQKVVEKSQGPLIIEFEKVLKEITMGKQRKEALRDMAERVDIEDITIFISSIIQADQLGVSITNVLRVQSAQVRKNRKMKAEEKAQKAPVKILIPLLLFVFPTILLILLGPAYLNFMNALG